MLLFLNLMVQVPVANTLMSGRAVILLGSLYDFENGCAVDPIFLRDLKNFCSLPSNQLSIVLEKLKQTDSYMNVEAIINFEYETNVADSVLRFLKCFSVGTEGFVEWLAELRASSDIVQRELSENDWESFQENFRLVQTAVPLRCVVSHVKCENLQTIIGNQFQDVDIICDIRPIFDATHEIVEGLIPITVLKFSYLTQVEETKALEIVLTEEHIDYLAGKIRAAKKKLDVLQKTFSKSESVT